MSYFIGHNLDRKIQEYDLADLDTLLSSIANGTGTWPGDLAAPAPANQLETLRVIFYSMLHKYGLKSEFIVKMSPALLSVSIHFKYAAAQPKRTGGVIRVGSVDNVTPAFMPAATEQLDTSALFSTDDPLLSSAQTQEEES